MVHLQECGFSSRGSRREETVGSCSCFALCQPCGVGGDCAAVCQDQGLARFLLLERRVVLTPVMGLCGAMGRCARRHGVRQSVPSLSAETWDG